MLTAFVASPNCWHCRGASWHAEKHGTLQDIKSLGETLETVLCLQCWRNVAYLVIYRRWNLKICSYFLTPKIGELVQFDEYFSDRLKSPTIYVLDLPFTHKMRIPPHHQHDTFLGSGIPKYTFKCHRNWVGG